MTNRHGLERALVLLLAGICGVALLACSGDDTGNGGGGSSGQGLAAGAGGSAADGNGGVGGASGVQSAAGIGGVGGSAGTGMSGAGAAGGSIADSGMPDGSADSTEDDASLPEPSDELIGWASVDALDVDGTTGGEGGEVVTATTADELIEYAASDDRLVILIQGEIDAPNVAIASNKTLRGMPGARINGGLGIRGSADEPIMNVIVQDLEINGATSDVDGDAMQLYYAHHVWIDHCEIYDGPDGNLDIVHASDYITVSWTKFRYTSAAPDPAHKFCNLIGHDDPNEEDEGKLNVTMHHNWWAEGVIERMPRVRYGKVHSLNNYFSSAGNNYVIRAGFQASILIEGNYFDGVGTPHEIDGDGASVVEMNNIYDGTEGAQDTAGSAFDPPYDYVADPASAIPASVMAAAGPR
jgi:pectate lyase